MKRLVMLAVISAILVASCGAQPEPTATPRPPPTQPEAAAATATLALATQPSASPALAPATSTPAPAPATPAPPASPTSQALAPDTIYFNANILTLDAGQPNASAIAIQDDKILALGWDGDILALADAGTQVVDLGGLTLTPGFIDSHQHRIIGRQKWDFSTVGEAVQEALSMGWTGLGELAVGQDRLQEMIAASDAGELRTRVNVYLTVVSFEGERLGDWYQDYESGQELGPNLRVAGLKIWIDYDSGRMLTWEQDELNEFVSQRHSEGWQIAIRAVGIRSHELALNAYRYALGGQGIYQHRHRIEHSLAANDAQIATMAQMGIIASIEPAYPAVLWHEEDIRNVGEEQGLHNMYRWRDYVESGLFVIASTHNPPAWVGYTLDAELFEPSHLSPMGVIYRGATQIGLGGRQPEDWMLRSALTVEELLPMLTIHGAYATFEEDVKGSLAPGKWADLAILDRDPRAVDVRELADIKTLMTMVGGQVEYCADPQAALCLPPGVVSTTTFSAACGRWVATDSDGSSMTLEVKQNPDESHHIVMIDEDAAACRTDSDGQDAMAFRAEGRGTASGFTLDLHGVVGICEDTGRTISFDIHFTYDPGSDTLSDSYGIRWHRE